MNKEQELITVLRTCEALILMERFDEAEQLYLGLQEGFAFHSLMGRAVVASKRGEAQRVVDLTSAALELKAADPEALLSRGHGNLELGKTEEAVEDFRRARELAPESSMGAYSLGLGLARRGAAKEAEVYFQEAFTREPEVVPFGLALARVRLQQLNVESAFEVLKSVVEAAPERPEAYLELATILSSVGHREAAYGILESAERLAKIEDPELLHEMSKLAVLLELKEEALAALARLDQVVEETPEGLCEMGTLALAAKSIEDALGYFDRALKLDGAYGPGYYLLGVCFDALGEVEQSERAYRMAVRLMAGDWKPLNNLAALLLEREDEESLVEVGSLLKEAERVSEETRPEIVMNKAQYERRLGHDETADLLLRTVLEMTEAGSKVREHASTVLMSLRDYKLH